MNGDLSIEDAFEQRIRILSPSKLTIARCLKEHTVSINSGVEEYLSLLRKRGVEYYLVSGGFFEVGVRWMI